MSKFIIEGFNPLQGEVDVAGNKNSALPILAATLLTSDECLIENVPDILDVHSMLSILKELGKNVESINKSTHKISGDIKSFELSKDSAGKLRASILFISGILSKFGKVKFAPPGGCVIGRRNLQSHFDIINAFGGKIKFDDEYYYAELLNPADEQIFLEESSVTATENAMLLVSTLPKEFLIENTASEPHVKELGEVLIKMGAEVWGNGTNRIKIKGKNKLRGFHHKIKSDHIEAGTFAIMAASTKGSLLIHNAEKQNFRMTELILKKMGVDLTFIDNNTLQVKPSHLKSSQRKVQAGIWPGFPTDLMSPLIVLATQSEGVTLCHDWLFESRMFFVDKLIIMGADITQCDPHRVLVYGPTQLRGQELSSPDIRAGIALVIAALTAQGESIIDRVELIDRGYENIVERLQSIGGLISRTE